MCTKEPAQPNGESHPQQQLPDSIREPSSTLKLRVLRTQERNLRKEDQGYLEDNDDFPLEDYYIMSEEEDDDEIPLGIPIRDAGLA
jgi:hypothetical protein